MQGMYDPFFNRPSATIIRLTAGFLTTSELTNSELRIKRVCKTVTFTRDFNFFQRRMTLWMTGMNLNSKSRQYYEL